MYLEQSIIGFYDFSERYMFFQTYSVLACKFIAVYHSLLYFTINILFVCASDTGRGLMTTKALQVSNVDCNAEASLGSLNCNH